MNMAVAQVVKHAQNPDEHDVVEEIFRYVFLRKKLEELRKEKTKEELSYEQFEEICNKNGFKDPQIRYAASDVIERMNRIIVVETYSDKQKYSLHEITFNSLKEKSSVIRLALNMPEEPELNL